MTQHVITERLMALTVDMGQGMRSVSYPVVVVVMMTDETSGLDQPVTFPKELDMYQVFHL
jgi:hypothetical protein